MLQARQCKRCWFFCCKARLQAHATGAAAKYMKNFAVQHIHGYDDDVMPCHSAAQCVAACKRDMKGRCLMNDWGRERERRFPAFPPSRPPPPIRPRACVCVCKCVEGAMGKVNNVMATPLSLSSDER